MKKIFLISLLAILLFACKSNTVYVPVESVRTEYRDRAEKDAVYFYDSIFMKIENDTIRLEKYKYLYRDRIVTDSVLVSDTISVPYPVVEVRETNRLSSFQSFQIWCGRIVLVLLGGWLLVKRIRP